jgi:aryl-alcohol dehydrogenase-like predicted oxidoreductase
VSLAREMSVTLNQIALAYLLHQPFPVFPIIGTGKASRVKEALAAVPLRLTTGQVEFLTTCP